MCLPRRQASQCVVEVLLQLKSKKEEALARAAAPGWPRSGCHKSAVTAAVRQWLDGAKV